LWERVGRAVEEALSGEVETLRAHLATGEDLAVVGCAGPGGDEAAGARVGTAPRRVGPRCTVV
jgi:hypothetical protein